MKTTLLFCILLMMLPLASNGATLDLSWSTLMNEGNGPEGELLGEALKLVNTSDEPKTFTLLVLPQPGITSPSYAINGHVKYEGVEGTGYLEMRNHFPGEKVYFTKTLGSSGPLRSIQGSSDWREFSLPFVAKDESGWLPDRPVKLEMNLVLPGKGTVYLRPVNLVNQDKGDTPAKAWWGPRTSGLIGAIFGGTIGLLSAITGVLAARGQARGVVLSIYWGLLGVGLCALAGGIFAVISHQPCTVYYTLLFPGVLVSLMSLILMPVIRRRYQDQELRRMSAADA